MRRVVVTGLGLVTPLGCGVDVSWKNILDTKSGIKAIDTFDVSDLPSKIAGFVPKGTGAGQFNLGAYCNPKLDALTKQIQSETDKAKRDDLIKQAFALHAEDVGTLPLHQQTLAWGVSKKVTLTQLADNFMFFKWMSVKGD